jgi:hypothetical protein
MKLPRAAALFTLSSGLDLRELRKATTATRERRSVGGLELGTLTDAEKAEGYVGVLTGKIPLDTDSTVLRDRRINNGRPFVERIARNAFADSIDKGEDIMGMAGHTDATLAAFARSGANLVLSRDATAIHYRALLPDTQTGKDLLELAQKKIIRGTSFEFDLGAEDKWERRGYWVYTDTDYAYGDPTLTADSAFATEALGRELCRLTEAQEYLRAAPEGAHKVYAAAVVAASAAALTELIAWLATNGATVNPEFIERAKAKAKEARSAAPAAPKNVSDATPVSDDPRETGLRIFTR